MSEENRHIDDLFRSGLTGQETVPPPELWKKINEQLASRKRSRIIRAFFRIAAGVAILLGFGGSLIYYLIQDNPGDNYLSPETVTIPMSGQESAPDHSPFSIPLTEPLSGLAAGGTNLSGLLTGTDQSVTAGESDAFVTATGVRVKKKHGTDDLGYPDQINPLGAGRLQSSQERHLKSLVTTPVPVIHRNQELLPPHPGDGRGSRWQAGIMTAPNYSYRSLSRGPDKSIDKAAFNSTETGLVSLTAKIAVRYIINERLSFQSGFEIVNMGQSTGVILYDLSASQRLRSAYLQSGPPQEVPSFQNSLGTVRSAEDKILVTREHEWNYEGFTPFLLPVTENYNKLIDRGKVIQELHYIQTPFVLRFNLVNGNTTLLINAGLGLNFLAGNRVIFEQGGGTLNLGKTLGIRNISISGLAGAGIERNIGNNTSLVIEPRFTHFISSVNRTTVHRHHPWSISVFAGFSRKF
jgi:hypothetical protein